MASDERGLFCNRTLNLRSIQAIGYDMDYPLIHHDVEAWEGCAYQYLQEGLLQRGVDVGTLQFRPDLVARG